MERVQKVIANSGYCSRRVAEELISKGKVKINSIINTKLGTLINPLTDIIEVNGQIIKVNNSKVTYVLNKPKGVVCSTKKQGKEIIITNLINSEKSLYPIGRLDKESEGLILLTNDGKLTNFLLHPKNNKQKKYYVEAINAGNMNYEDIQKALLKGVKLGDGIARADNIELINQNGKEIHLTITVHEGRNHLIRRMLSVIKLKTKLLRRVELAGIKLGKLKIGQYRKLTLKEIQLISSIHES